MSDKCPDCGHKWEDHEFGVPSPFCPAKSELAPVSGSASRLQELKIKAYDRELQKCDQMLTDAGVPEWVMNSDSNGVPSNSVESRLKWYLARRKNVERWETDQALQRDMEENLRYSQAYEQARQNDQAHTPRANEH